MKLADFEPRVMAGSALALWCLRCREDVAAVTGLHLDDLAGIAVAHIAAEHPGQTVDCCRHCDDQPRSHAVTGRNAHLLACPEGCP